MSQTLAMPMRLLVALLVAGPLHAQPALQDDRAPVSEAIAGALAQGTFGAVGEAMAEMVRRQYPGSALAYEPGTLAGSLARVLEGKAMLALGDPLSITLALRGEPPFTRAYSRDDFGVVFRVVDGMGAYIVARARYLDRHGISSLADIERQQLPVRVASTIKSNLVTYKQVVGILDAHELPEKRIRSWGGAVHYIPGRNYAQMFADGQLDLIFTLGFPPRLADAVTRLAQTVDAKLLPIGDAAVVDALADDLGLETMTVAAEDYPLLNEAYYTTSTPIYVIAADEAPALLTYKLAKAVHAHFDYLRSIHSNFAGYQVDMLPQAGGFALHPGAAQLFREVGLIDD